MVKAESIARKCGFKTIARAIPNGKVSQLSFQNDCPAIQKLAAELTEVEPYKAISARKAMPRPLERGLKYCTHTACPAPSGIIEAVEIEEGLNLPVDTLICLSKT